MDNASQDAAPKEIISKRNSVTWEDPGYWIGVVGHVLTSGLSAGDKWPKILSNVGGLGGRGGMAP